MTDLSIIIVSYKGWKRLEKCLESLSSFRGESFSCEVIIVDNKSEDETLFEFENRYKKFRFIRNSVNGGFANGCNLGAKESNGSFLLFLNPDTVASESELKKLLDVARENLSFGIVSCSQINERGKKCIVSGPFPNLFNLTGFQRSVLKILTPHSSPLTPHSSPLTPHSSPLTPHSSPLTPHISFPDWVSGSVILLRKEVFEKINGFDEDFWMYFEDVDICRRVTNTGLKIALCGNIFIEHNHGGSSRINLKIASLTKTEVNISRHVYIGKHKKGIEKLVIQSFLVINNLITGFIMSLFGLLLFFIPKVFARTLIFLRLFKYYIVSVSKLSFISPRSVNFKKN